LLEQSTLDSTEQLLSEENTKVDKESVAATRSSSKTDNWRIDGSASISLGTFASASLQAGGSESVTDSAITSINQISEATQKSAKTLKTLHKIEVRGVTETSTQRRMKRTIKNPFADRTLSINVFAQLKRYSVETRLREFRPVLVFEARSLVFDETFIVANQDFLKNCLLDKSLVDALEIAASGANQTTTLQGAADLAERALDYLFGPDLGHPHVNGDVYGERGANVFNVDPIQNTPQTDANFPDTCFDAKLLKSTWNGIFSLEGAPYTGLSEAIGTDEKRALGLGEVYCALGYYRAIFRHEQDWLAEPRERTRLVQLALSIADQVGSTWEAFKAIGEGGLKSEANTYLWYVFNTDSYTEVFRRLPGFLSLVKGWLAPLVSATWEQEEQKKQVEAATAAVDRLLKHLQFHAGFYTRKYLSYLAGEAEGHAIVEFANKAIESTGRLGPSVPETLQSVFDANRAFVDGNQIIVPGMQPLNSEDMAKLAAVLPGSGTVPPELPPASVKPVVVELEIPSDGIHIEVAPGLCVLKGVWSEQVHKMLRVLFWASLAVAGGAFFLIASYIVYRLVALSR
jgi:hypothetical protein